MNSINNLLLIFLTCILMQSCDSPTQSQQTNSEHWSSDIVLVDTFRNKLHLAEVEYFTSKIYAPMYWGEIQDSIILVYNSKYVGDRGEFGFPNRDSFQIKSFSNLELYVDTSRDVGSAQYYTHPPPPPPGSSQKAIEDYEKAEFKPYRGNVLSHPIFIRNTGINAINIGCSDFLPLHLEAKDSLGNWNAIQKPGHSHSCFPISIKLEPQEIIIATCSQYSGDYLTKLRLVYSGNSRTIYSNEFEGMINYGQFEADPNGLNLPERNYMDEKW